MRDINLFQLALIGLGLLLGLGLVMLVAGIIGTDRPATHASSLRDDLTRIGQRLGKRLPVAIVLGVLVLIFTQWIVLAIAVVLVVMFAPALFGGAAAERHAYARLEGLAAWTESLRDTVAGAVGLEQAIPATAAAASPAIRSAIEELSDRLRMRMPLPQALLHFADDLDDPAADLVVAALVLNARLRGPGLRDVLSSLAESVRDEVEMRGRVMAGRSATRTSVQIVAIISFGVMIGLRLLNPSYVEPYGTPFGQAVLVLVLGLFALGFIWLRRLAAFEAPQRFLRSATDLPVQRSVRS